MGSSASKYLDPVSSLASAEDMVQRLSELIPGQGEGKGVIPKPDSQLNSTRETAGGNKVWGHNLLQSKESRRKAAVDGAPYHDDYEEVIDVYTEEIFPIDEPAVKKDDSHRPTQTQSLQDVPTMELPPSGHRSPLKHRNKVDPDLPPRTPKKAFVNSKSKTKPRPQLKNIEDIRLQQHERIMEQMRMYDAQAPPPPKSPAKADDDRRSNKADDLLKDLKLQDESLEQVPMKAVASEGGKKPNLKGKPQAWTQSNKSYSEIAAHRLAAAKRVEAQLSQRSGSASGPTDGSKAQQAARRRPGEVGSLEKTIMDLEIL